LGQIPARETDDADVPALPVATVPAGVVVGVAADEELELDFELLLQPAASMASATATAPVAMMDLLVGTAGTPSWFGGRKKGSERSP